jgi:hypothetical protein
MATYTNQSQLPTYRAATTASVVAAAGDKVFFLIEGASGKTVLVRKLWLSGSTLTAVAYNTYAVRKFSTAASGGTATALVETPTSSKFPAASAVAQVFTAAPTEGTLVGTIDARRVLLQSTTAAAAGIPDTIEFDFTTNDGGGILLHAATEGLGVGFAAAPATAVTLAVACEFQEF